MSQEKIPGEVKKITLGVPDGEKGNYSKILKKKVIKIRDLAPGEIQVFFWGARFLCLCVFVFLLKQAIKSLIIIEAHNLIMTC